VHVLADHGAFDACADPSKWPAGFFNICTGSYDIPTAYLAVDGVYTNKAPGGVAYRCSFRVTEAAYFIERAVDCWPQARHGRGRAAHEELHQARAVPLSVGARLGV
jgi:carbon-monoxide dehydrogenase large subunit